MSNEKKISLQPLKFDEAIADLLKVKPANRNRKRGGRRQGGPPRKWAKVTILAALLWA
jgi:hypothetical protein